MRPLSLKWRVSLLVLAAMVAAIIAVLAVAYAETKELVVAETNQALLAMSKGIVSVLQQPEPVAVRKKQIDAIVGLSHRTPAPFYAASLSGGDVLAGGSLLERATMKDVTGGRAAPAIDRSTFFDSRRPSGHYRAIWTRVRTDAGEANIVVGVPTKGVQDELKELVTTLLLIGAGVIGVAVVLVMLLVAWGLRPIRLTAQRLMKVTASNVGCVELDGKRVPQEIRPFVESVSAMLGRLDRAMRQQKTFVADASHEFRTPIALAKSTVQLALIKDRTLPEYQKALHDTLGNLRRMEHLVEELMVLARMDESAGLPDVADVDLAALLSELQEVFSPRAEQRGCRLVMNVQPAVVRGNPNHLTRLFSNLLDNALKYGPEESTIQVSAVQEPEGVVAITVHDEGGCIPADDLPHLFTRFYRADPSRSQASGGAGLGLAIAKEIVIRHGGQIAITSDPHSGTDVCVRLHLVQ